MHFYVTHPTDMLDLRGSLTCNIVGSIALSKDFPFTSIGIFLSNNTPVALPFNHVLLILFYIILSIIQFSWNIKFRYMNCKHLSITVTFNLTLISLVLCWINLQSISLILLQVILRPFASRLFLHNSSFWLTCSRDYYLTQHSLKSTYNITQLVHY